MKASQFTYKINKSPLMVKGGYLREAIMNNTQLGVINKEKNELCLLFKENVTREAFEKDLLETIRAERPSAYLKLMLQNHIGSLLTIFMSVLIVLFIALLSIHGSMTYDLFTGNNGENILGVPSAYFYVFLTLIILVMLYFSPKIILGEFNNLLEWAEAKLTSDKKIRKRLARQLLALKDKKNMMEPLLVCNPFVQGSDSWIVHHVLPVLFSLKYPVHIHVKSDEKNEVMKILDQNNLALVEEKASQESSEYPLAGTVFPVEILSKSEKERLAILAFSSMLNIPDNWGVPEQYVFSQNLFEIIDELFNDKIYSSRQDYLSAERFVSRCIVDYGYLKEEQVFGRRRLFFQPEFVNVKWDSLVNNELTDAILSNISSLIKMISDPLADLIILGMLDNEENTLTPKRLPLLENFIENTLMTENFILFSDYWKHVSKIKEEDNFGFQFRILHFLSVKGLKNLSVCFVNSGMYENAMEVYQILENIFPVKAAIDMADMQDSLGNYKEALKILFETDEKWAQTGIVRDEGLLLELYLNIAWIIVSGRFAEEKEKGFYYLDKTDAILKRLPDSEEYLTYLVRFYNTRANYSEWEQKYLKAIEDYEKALKLPGSILRKSSLLSNRGIAERLLGNSIAVHAGQQIEHYRKARSNARQGLEMKKAIGEKNQIPGSSHNYAETLLELSNAIDDKAEKKHLLREVLLVTSNALSLLHELNSEKRKGRLLTERYISAYHLNELGETTDAGKFLSELQEWLGKEDKASYDYREIQRLLQRFSIKV